jgi:hypothetical protein
MALMAAHGEITPMPDAAIFADTGDEPSWVYETLSWLKSGNVLPFPVHIAQRGRLSEHMLNGEDAARIPFYVKAGGLSKRQCTRNYKLRPIRREVCKLLGVGPRDYIAPGAVEQWIGISRDEADRMKPSGARFVVNRWPLIELGLTRLQCEAWLRRHDYPVPGKSSCVYCPYRRNDQWRELRDRDPRGFAEATRVDAALRTPENVKRFRGELYVHPSCVPLAEVDLTVPQSPQLNLFANECEGMCGV